MHFLDEYAVMKYAPFATLLPLTRKRTPRDYKEMVLFCKESKQFHIYPKKLFIR